MAIIIGLSIDARAGNASSRSMMLSALSHASQNTSQTERANRLIFIAVADTLATKTKKTLMTAMPMRKRKKLRTRAALATTMHQLRRRPRQATRTKPTPLKMARRPNSRTKGTQKTETRRKERKRSSQRRKSTTKRAKMMVMLLRRRMEQPRSPPPLPTRPRSRLPRRLLLRRMARRLPPLLRVAMARRSKRLSLQQRE